jgi:hypothetical protein
MMTKYIVRITVVLYLKYLTGLNKEDRENFQHSLFLNRRAW